MLKIAGHDFGIVFSAGLRFGALREGAKIRKLRGVSPLSKRPQGADGLRRESMRGAAQPSAQGVWRPV